MSISSGVNDIIVIGTEAHGEAPEQARGDVSLEIQNGWSEAPGEAPEAACEIAVAMLALQQ